MLEFYLLLYLFTLLDLVNDMVGNKIYYSTSGKQDVRTLNIRKTEKKQR